MSGQQVELGQITSSSAEHQESQTAEPQGSQAAEPQVSPADSSPSSVSSPSNSISLIKLDELSSFGATKQGRLPALIKLNSVSDPSNKGNRQLVSMPALSAEQLEQSPPGERQQVSLPAQMSSQSAGESADAGDKENQLAAGALDDEPDPAEDYQVVDMVSGDADMMGPSLPQPREQQKSLAARQKASERAALTASQQFDNQHPSHLGDSLIEMIINLKNENQELVRALETNNEYVKDRLSEFKRVQEEAKRRETQFAKEKADHEHQVRKLQRQNGVLSERLKSMEAKLKDMKLEVSDSLVAAHSSKASSLRDGFQEQLYPNLAESDSFTNSAFNRAEQNEATTMQIDAASGELYNPGDKAASDGASSPSAPPMETDVEGEPSSSAAHQVGAMTKEQLSQRFDAHKSSAIDDDPMKECDKLEKQLNDIGKRDYEICLLQQQLNIYRQDFRLERMAKLEAKIQIERLRNDIDRLCFERLQEKTKLHGDDETRAKHLHRSQHGGARFDAAAAAEAAISRLGHQLSKKAVKSAAKAARYASKQAYKEEKAAAVAAAAAAAMAAKAARQADGAHRQPSAPPASATSGAEQPQASQDYHTHRRHHSHHYGGKNLRQVRSEVVNDLLSTANKAVLTGYKMASTHVNLALDKLSQFEQTQASHLAQNREKSASQQADRMGPPPSVD